MPTKMIFLTSGSIFTVPTDFVSLISVECIGPGAPGSLLGPSHVAGGGGGGGGAYAKIISLSGINIGNVYNIQVPPGASTGSPTTLGTWFSSPTTVYADYGKVSSNPPLNTNGGVGGSSASSVGYLRYSGGNGGNGAFYGGGGGGAAGLNGNGNNGSAGSSQPTPNTGIGGSGDSGFGGVGGGVFGWIDSNGREYLSSPAYGSGGGGAGQSEPLGAVNAGGTYGGGGGGAGSAPADNGGPSSGGLIVFTYISSNSSSSSSSSTMSSSSSGGGGGSGSGANSSNSSGWVPTSPSRQCIRLAEPQDTTIEQVNGLALTVYANVPYGLLYQNAPYFPVSGPDVLSMWSLDPQGNQATLSINCTLYMSDNGYVFISNDNGKQYLVASINAPFFDANATVINTRNQAILANPVMPCANADRYDYPALLPNQAIPNTFYRDGMLLGSSSGPQTIIG